MARGGLVDLHPLREQRVERRGSSFGCGGVRVDRGLAEARHPRDGLGEPWAVGSPAGTGAKRNAVERRLADDRQPGMVPVEHGHRNRSLTEAQLREQAQRAALVLEPRVVSGIARELDHDRRRAGGAVEEEHQHLLRRVSPGGGQCEPPGFDLEPGLCGELLEVVGRPVGPAREGSDPGRQAAGPIPPDPAPDALGRRAPHPRVGAGVCLQEGDGVLIRQRRRGLDLARRRPEPVQPGVREPVVACVHEGNAVRTQEPADSGDRPARVRDQQVGGPEPRRRPRRRRPSAPSVEGPGASPASRVPGRLRCPAREWEAGSASSRPRWRPSGSTRARTVSRGWRRAPATSRSAGALRGSASARGRSG